MPVEQTNPFIIGEKSSDDENKVLVNRLAEALSQCADRLDSEVGFTGEANTARLLLDEINYQEGE